MFASTFFFTLQHALRVSTVSTISGCPPLPVTFSTELLYHLYQHNLCSKKKKHVLILDINVYVNIIH